MQSAPTTIPKYHKWDGLKNSFGSSNPKMKGQCTFSGDFLLGLSIAASHCIHACAQREGKDVVSVVASKGTNHVRLWPQAYDLILPYLSS